MWSQSRDMTAGKWDSGRTAAAPHLLCWLFLEDKEQAGWPLAERADKINGFEMSSDNGPFRPLSGVILWLFFCMSCGNGRLEKEIWGEFEETAKHRNIADSYWSFQHLRAHLMIPEFWVPTQRSHQIFISFLWSLLKDDSKDGFVL